MSERRGKIAIIGAGEVGSAFAYAMQIHGTAREIVLVDLNHERAKGQAMDLSHGAFFCPAADIDAGSYDDCADADVIVITAGAGQKPGQSRMELVQTNVDICKKIVDEITRRTREAILIMVTNPVDVLTYAALRFSGLPEGRVIGSGTVLDTARFRYLLSEHCRVSPQSIHAYVIGEHGDSEVMAWSTATLAGMRLSEFCSACPRHCPDIEREEIASQVRRSAYHIIEAKGHTNFAVGLALNRIVTSILRDANNILTVSTLMKGQFGIDDVCLGIPGIVGRNGMERIVCPALSEADQEALRASADAVKKVQKEVGL